MFSCLHTYRYCILYDSFVFTLHHHSSLWYTIQLTQKIFRLSTDPCSNFNDKQEWPPLNFTLSILEGERSQWTDIDGKCHQCQHIMVSQAIYSSLCTSVRSDLSCSNWCKTQTFNWQTTYRLLEARSAVAIQRLMQGSDIHWTFNGQNIHQLEEGNGQL